MSDSRRKIRKAGDAAFEAIGWSEGPHTLERDLLGYYFMYRADPKTTLAAFEALERITAHWWDDDVNVDRPDPDFGLDPTTLVAVPWWVVHLLGRCWNNYRSQRPRPRVGQAFLLEGMKRGEHTQVSKFETLRKRLGIALEIAHRLHLAEDEGKKSSLEDVISEIASEFAVSFDAAWGAWKEHGGEIQRRLHMHLR